jgi:hypothetical protein
LFSPFQDWKVAAHAADQERPLPFPASGPIQPLALPVKGWRKCQEGVISRARHDVPFLHFIFIEGTTPTAMLGSGSTNAPVATIPFLKVAVLKLDI